MIEITSPVFSNIIEIRIMFKLRQVTSYNEVCIPIGKTNAAAIRSPFLQ